MTQENKDLLLIDLCARLHYGIKCYYNSPEIDDDIPEGISVIKGFQNEGLLVEIESGDVIDIDYVKPYLRPISNITKEERIYISDKCGFSISGPIRNECELIMPVPAADWLIDFYNEHHIDYRGLIHIGLALEAPEEMYES